MTRERWYSLRMEHIHTLPQEWTVADELERFRAWRSLGVDDMLDVSVPWSRDPRVGVTDRVVPAGAEGGTHTLMIREYETPSGVLEHAVRKTGEDPGPGWVVQPDHVPLVEDFNIPRAVRHLVGSPAEVGAVRYVYAPPDESAGAWFGARMSEIGRFSRSEGAVVQAWSAFGTDAAVWFCGAEGAVLMAVDHPDEFARLVETIAGTDRARTELACRSGDVDIVVQRGWYSSTDFWSPSLFDRHVYPHLEELVDLAHGHGKKFAYVMTTGVERLGPRLADAGVDLLYFLDPVQDRASLETGVRLASRGMTVAGGISAVTLERGDASCIESEVKRALDALGQTRRFILQPVDALFPDTPWRSVEVLIDAWKTHRR